MDLLVLAAGMGSRFGGLKQLEPVGPSGEFILDYSIKDAIDAGFKRVIFVIKRENLQIFKDTIGKRIEQFIEVKYAFQEVDDVPIKVNVSREKPWGTVQAILCAKKFVRDKFVLINADDFYGKDAYIKAYQELKKLNEDNKFSSVLYEAKATLSENGAVKRGLCEIDGDNVKEIIESSVQEKEGNLFCEPLDGSGSFKKDLGSLVSMNMFLFDKSIFKILDEEFIKFLENEKNWKSNECLITNVINDKLSKGEVELRYIKTKAKWIGMTYRSDLDLVKEEINKLVEQKEYKESLWS